MEIRNLQRVKRRLHKATCKPSQLTILNYFLEIIHNNLIRYTKEKNQTEKTNVNKTKLIYFLKCKGYIAFYVEKGGWTSE